MKAHRVSGLAWWLAMLWLGLGAAISADAFAASAHRFDVYLSRFPAWAGEPQVLVGAAEVGMVVWLALTFPVLAAGVFRLCGRETPDPIREGAWAGTWIAGIALMVLVFLLGLGTPAPVYACSPHGGCAASTNSPAVVLWGELPVCAAFLALAALSCWILARPAQPRP